MDIITFNLSIQIFTRKTYVRYWRLRHIWYLKVHDWSIIRYISKWPLFSFAYSFLYLDLYVLGDDALISYGYFMHMC